MSNNKLILWLRSLNIFRYEATKCGHRTKKAGSVSAFGCSVNTKMPKNKYGAVDYCLDCIGSMAIQCAWCKKPIFIGDPVTLYTPKSDFEVPDHAVAYSYEPLVLVGCLGWGCADTGADRAGFWLPDENGNGGVKRVPTAFEAILGTEESSSVMVNDLNDISEAAKLISSHSKK